MPEQVDHVFVIDIAVLGEICIGGNGIAVGEHGVPQKINDIFVVYLTILGKVTGSLLMCADVADSVYKVMGFCFQRCAAEGAIPEMEIVVALPAARGVLGDPLCAADGADGGADCLILVGRTLCVSPGGLQQRVVTRCDGQGGLVGGIASVGNCL